MNHPTKTNPEAPKVTAPEELIITPHLKWKAERDEKTGKETFGKLTVSDGNEDLQSMLQALKRTTGTTDPDISTKILAQIAYGFSSNSPVSRMNDAATMLAALNPKDETEALLLGQFIALQDSAMQCLRNANSQDMFYHIERLFSLATKLFNTANQTMQTVLKYRSGGQQTVQVIHVHNEGQAIVAQNIATHPTSGRGEEKKTSTEPHGSL